MCAAMTVAVSFGPNGAKSWAALCTGVVVAVGIVVGCSPAENQATTSNSTASFRSSAGKVCRTYGERVDRIRGLRSSRAAVLGIALTKVQMALIGETKELERLQAPPNLRHDFLRLISMANVRFRFLGLIAGRAANVGRRAFTEGATASSWRRMGRDYRLLAGRLRLPACDHQLNLSP